MAASPLEAEAGDPLCSRSETFRRMPSFCLFFQQLLRMKPNPQRRRTSAAEAECSHSNNDLLPAPLFLRRSRPQPKSKSKRPLDLRRKLPSFVAENQPTTVGGGCCSSESICAATLCTADRPMLPAFRAGISACRPVVVVDEGDAAGQQEAPPAADVCLQ